MNYREQQLRNEIKKNHVPLNQFQLLQTEYQRVLIDVDYQLQVETKEENERLKEELTNLKEFSEEQHQSITQLETELKEQTEAIHELNRNLQNQQKLSQSLTILADKRKEDLEREKKALLALAKQKIEKKKEWQELLTSLEEKWQSEKEELEQEQAQLREQIQETNKEFNEKKQAHNDLSIQHNNLRQAYEQLEKEKETQEKALNAQTQEQELAKKDLAEKQTEVKDLTAQLLAEKNNPKLNDWEKRIIAGLSKLKIDQTQEICDFLFKEGVGNISSDIHSLTKAFPVLRNMPQQLWINTSDLLQKTTELSQTKAQLVDELRKQSAKMGGSWQSFYDWLRFNIANGYKPSFSKYYLTFFSPKGLKSYLNYTNGSNPLVYLADYSDDKTVNELFPAGIGVFNVNYSHYEATLGQMVEEWRNQSISYQNYLKNTQIQQELQAQQEINKQLLDTKKTLGNAYSEINALKAKVKENRQELNEKITEKDNQIRALTLDKEELLRLVEKEKKDQETQTEEEKE